MSISTTFSETLLASATQTRFCAVFLDQETLLPIIGLPIYAEALCTPAFTEDIELNADIRSQIFKVLRELSFSDAQMKAFENALLIYLRLNYGQPSTKELESIIDYVLQKMLANKDEILKNYSEDQILGLIVDVIKALIDKQVISPPHLDKKEEHVNLHIPFGYLATDQVGYVSFDIEKAIKKTFKEFENSQLHFEYWMYPNGDLNKGVNVSNMERLNSSYIFGNIKLTNYQKNKSNISYHSLQNPGLIDWYLSPSSFSINPKHFLGEDGCEKLYPANFATSEFRFFQIVRGKEINSNQNDLTIRHGFAYEYITVWQPLGHTLGQIIYSLPLAPGEVIKIGIIDWKRNSEDTRAEDTSESEELTHDTYRDRTISETVDAALTEWQRGGSVMGGNSGGAGASFGIPIFGAAAGNAHSFGGGYSTSSGDRDFTASTVQQVNDAFSQHSTAIRELRSTVVVQSDQQEYARAETRVIANNNHSHALTMLYYEVLRHFKVTTQFVRKRNVLLVDYSRWHIDFNNEYVINQYRKILETSLLEPRYITYFDAVHIYICHKLETDYHNKKIIQPEDQGELIFGNFYIEFVTGNSDMDNGYNGVAEVSIRTKGNTEYPLKDMGIDREWFDGSFEPGETDRFDAWTDLDLKWSDMDTITIKPKGEAEWFLHKFLLKGISETGEQKILFDAVIDTKMEEGDVADAQKVTRKTIRPPVREVIPGQNAMDVIQPQERMHIDLLKRHLIDNANYYCRMIWLNQDLNDRAKWMEDVSLDSGGKLIDKLENRPIEVLGNYVVFPSNIQQDEEENLKQPYAKAEKLMTLPTRGVFAEAKLGHCNASEIIDNTRFWDWQQSPIQEKAPEIDSISTESRNVTQNLTPTSFPSSIVNIVNPTAVPDPTAMSGALNLLGKSDIFRNMSMSAEVTDLLKKLSDNSVSFAEAANQARGILAKDDSKSGGVSSNKGISGNTPETGSQTEQTAGAVQKPQDVMDWTNAIKNSGLSDKDKKDALQDVTEGTKKAVNPKVPARPKKVKKDHLTFQINLVGEGTGKLIGRFGTTIQQRGTDVGFLVAVDRSETGVLIIGVSHEFNDSRYHIIVEGEILGGVGVNTILNGSNTLTIPPADLELYDYFYFKALAKTASFDIETTKSDEVVSEVAKKVGGDVGGSYKNIISMKVEGGGEWKDGQSHTSQTVVKVKVIYYTGIFEISYVKAE